MIIQRDLYFDDECDMHRDRTLKDKFELVYYSDEKSIDDYTDEDEILYYDICDTLQEVALLLISNFSIANREVGTLVVYYNQRAIKHITELYELCD